MFFSKKKLRKAAAKNADAWTVAIDALNKEAEAAIAITDLGQRYLALEMFKLKLDNLERDMKRLINDQAKVGWVHNAVFGTTEAALIFGGFAAGVMSGGLGFFAMGALGAGGVITGEAHFTKHVQAKKSEMLRQEGAAFFNVLDALSERVAVQQSELMSPDGLSKMSASPLFDFICEGFPNVAVAFAKVAKKPVPESCAIPTIMIKKTKPQA